jgi:hypothetical protein
MDKALARKITPVAGSDVELIVPGIVDQSKVGEYDEFTLG